MLLTRPVRALILLAIVAAVIGYFLWTNLPK